MLRRLAALLLAVLPAGPAAAMDADPYCQTADAPKPEDLCALIMQAKTANGAGDTDKALALLKQARDHPATVGKTAALVLGQKATAHALRGETEQALAALQSALQFTPNDIWLLMRSCQDHAAADYLPKAQRDCARARNLLRRVRKEDRPLVLAYVNYSEAQLALAMEQPQITLDRLQTIESQMPGRIAARYLNQLRASALIAQGDSAGAVQALTDVLASEQAIGLSEQASLHYLRGLERIAIAANEAGLADIRQAIALSRSAEQEAGTRAAQTRSVADQNTLQRATSRTAEYTYTLCAIHLRSGDVMAALRDCEALSETAPGQQNHVYLDAWGLAQLEGGRAAEAARTFSDALEKAPRSSISYGHLNRAVGQAQAEGKALDLDEFLTPEARLFHRK
ncbi:hypothetical protein ACFMPD_14070 [Sedimentitalea sp. HM32M-2]|uniref:tetratricopeptide repeat protein n=1 Tax=Sedimentitalea sp. HM32M-2 TaxID=3351566 RepID=UPI003626E236